MQTAETIDKQKLIEFLTQKENECNTEIKMSMCSDSWNCGKLELIEEIFKYINNQGV